MKNWFTTGFAAGNEQMDAEIKARSTGRGPTSPASNRYWMPKDSEKSVVFLTDEPFLFLEHNWKQGTSFRNWGSCLKPLGESCGYCEQDMTRYTAAAFTVVDCSPWTDKDGNEHKFTKRLFIAKSGVWEKIERERRLLAEDDNKLRGAAFRIFRGKDPKSPGTGEDFKFRKMVDLDAWDFKDTDEYDYAELFCPDAERMRSVVAELTVGAAPAAPTIEADDIPF